MDTETSHPGIKLPCPPPSLASDDSSRLRKLSDTELGVPGMRTLFAKEHQIPKRQSSPILEQQRK